MKNNDHHSHDFLRGILREWKQYHLEDKLKTIADQSKEWTLLHMCANRNNHVAMEVILDIGVIDVD